MTDQTALVKVSNYFQSDPVRSRFRDVLGGREAGAYIASVMLAVADNDALQKCSLQSIYHSAMRAASLHLSVDPATGHAYLIPYKGVCTFVPGYKGYIHMGVRTNQYRYINVGPVYEGESIVEDRMSGFLKFEGAKKSNTVIGWIAAFEMVNGYGHSLYMTIDEIHAHAKKYNPAGYNSERGKWKTDPAGMERKTPLRILLSQWGFMDPADVAILEDVESGKDFIDGEIVDAPPEPTEAEKQATVEKDAARSSKLDAALGIDPEPEPPAMDPAQDLSPEQVSEKVNGNAKPPDAAPSTKAWQEWDKLVEEAEALGLTITEPPKDVTTPQLRSMYKEMSEQIKDKKASQ